MAEETVSIFWLWAHLAQIKDLGIGNWITIIGSGAVAAGGSWPAVGRPDWKVMLPAFVTFTLLALKATLDAAPHQKQLEAAVSAMGVPPSIAKAKGKAIIDEKTGSVNLN